MTNPDWKVAVTSRSFSSNQQLREELLRAYPRAYFNESGASLRDEALCDFLDGCDAAIVALEPVEERLLARVPQLQVVSKYGVGLDQIDFAAMRRHSVKLAWRGGVNRRSVSELVVALSICALRSVVAANQEVRSGGWRQHIGGQLTGKVVGIVGLGNVGKDLVGLLEPFGCEFLAHDIRSYEAFECDNKVRTTTLDELLQQSDVVSLHVPLTDLTRGMLSAQRLELMKLGSVLINTARGDLVDELALREQLQSGKLGAAAFDVFANEPPTDDVLLGLPNFIATPHIGGSAREAILARVAIAEDFILE